MLVLGPDAALDSIGVAAAVAGTLCMATGVVLTQHWGRPVDLVTFTGWQLSAGGLMLAPIVIIVEGHPTSITATNIAGFAWLAIAGTGAAYANWFAGIQRLPINIISFLGLLSPLVATIAGWAVLDQTLTATQLAGAALVLAAVIAPQIPTHRNHPMNTATESANAPPHRRHREPLKTRQSDRDRERITTRARPRSTHSRTALRRSDRRSRTRVADQGFRLCLS